MTPTPTCTLLPSFCGLPAALPNALIVCRYYGYLNTLGGYDTYQIRRCNLDGSSDTVVYDQIYYERPEYGQYIADIGLDLVNRDFYVIG